MKPVCRLQASREMTNSAYFYIIVSVSSRWICLSAHIDHIQLLYSKHSPKWRLNKQFHGLRVHMCISCMLTKKKDYKYSQKTMFSFCNSAISRAQPQHLSTSVKTLDSSVLFPILICLLFINFWAHSLPFQQNGGNSSELFYSIKFILL